MDPSALGIGVHLDSATGTAGRRSAAVRRHTTGGADGSRAARTADSGEIVIDVVVRHGRPVAAAPPIPSRDRLPTTSWGDERERHPEQQGTNEGAGQGGKGQKDLATRLTKAAQMAYFLRLTTNCQNS